ncbi:unnamed protein product [Calypogeia fissa]
MEGAPASSASSPTTSGTTITPSSPAASSSPGGGFDSPSSTASGGTSSLVPEHTPPRRRLVKASSIIAKREAAAPGAAAGPPGFGLDRSSVTAPASSIGTGSGPAGTPLGLPSSTCTSPSTFRERAGIRLLVKSDVQGEFPMMPAHGSGGSSGSAKLGRPPFVPNAGIMGEIRPLGRRSELASQRRHEAPAVQKHAPEDIRIQQNKRACLTRAQNMGATGNYKNFDSPFGNYMVPVIPNHLFNKTSTSSPISTSTSTLSPGVGR